MRATSDTRVAEAASRTRQCVLAGAWRIELLARAGYEAAYTPELPSVRFAFDGQVEVHAFGGDRRTGFGVRPDSLAYVPTGRDVFSRSESGGPAEWPA